MKGWLVLLFAVACKPTPLAGAYLCNPQDQACPGSQHCTCGLCVDQDEQAACGFHVTAQTMGSVFEHQIFPLSIQAVTADGGPSSFSGTVQLSATLGDIRPTSVQLSGGTVTVPVAVNREAARPAETITVSFAGVRATTAPLVVVAPPITADPQETMAPDAAFGPGSWAKVMHYASVYPGTAAPLEAVFIGGSNNVRQLGHALSNDDAGRSFTPDSPNPVWTTDGGCPDLSTATVYRGADGGLFLAYSRVSAKGLFLASFSNDTPVPFDCDGGTCVPQCLMCSTPGSDPYVIEVPPEVDSRCGGPKWMMFYQSQRPIPSMQYDITSLGVATSCDGVNFVPYPEPPDDALNLYSSVLFGPRVILDGTVFKMWFTYSEDPQNYIATEYFCGPDVDAGIGYATSRDGILWTTSPSNPVFSIGDAPFWSHGFTAHTLRVTSVVATDGVDAWNGVTLFYTPYSDTPADDGGSCESRGLARATRN